MPLTAFRYNSLPEVLFPVSPLPWDFILRDARRGDPEALRVKETIIARLSVDLIEKYHYRLFQIQLREIIPVVSQTGWDYLEADVVVKNSSGAPSLLIAVSPPETYEENFVSSVRQIFQLASLLGQGPSAAPRFLVYYSQAREKGELREKISTIDFRSFPTFELWQALGSPREHIIPDAAAIEKQPQDAD